jgi:hypothetical protein
VRCLWHPFSSYFGKGEKGDFDVLFPYFFHSFSPFSNEKGEKSWKK